LIQHGVRPPGEPFVGRGWTTDPSPGRAGRLVAVVTHAVHAAADDDQEPYKQDYQDQLRDHIRSPPAGIQAGSFTSD
jgi:hypothetical protein